MEQYTIGLLNDSFPPSVDGVSNTVVNYARIIEKDYGHSFVVTPNMAGHDDSVYPFPVYRYPSINTVKQFGFVTGVPVDFNVRKDIIEAKPDLMHVHCPTVSLILARGLRETLDCPLVFTYHTKFDVEIQRVLKGKPIQDVATLALIENVCAADEIWAVSQGAADNLKAMGCKSNIVVMKNGCDVEKGRLPQDVIDGYTKKYGFPAGVPVFLFVGRMIEYKGQRLILDALKGLFDENVDFRMLFVGDGADLETLKAYSESLGMAEKVVFTGAIRNREEIRALYGFADLFLFPSTYDTNGLVVTEAAGSGTASVLVRGSAAAENITDGRNGFLINETAVSLFATLWKLTQHPEKMKEAGEHALEEVYFSWDDAIKAAYKRYDYLIHSYKTGELPRRKENFADLILANDGRFAQTILDVRDFFQNAAETLFR